jgi:hypothetical protein
MKKDITAGEGCRGAVGGGREDRQRPWRPVCCSAIGLSLITSAGPSRASRRRLLQDKMLEIKRYGNERN